MHCKVAYALCKPQQLCRRILFELLALQSNDRHCFMGKHKTHDFDYHESSRSRRRLWKQQNAAMAAWRNGFAFRKCLTSKTLAFLRRKCFERRLNCLLCVLDPKRLLFRDRLAFLTGRVHWPRGGEAAFQHSCLRFSRGSRCVASCSAFERATQHFTGFQLFSRDVLVFIQRC